MKNAINADYGSLSAGGFVERLLAAQRRGMFEAFMVFKQGDPADSVLHVGPPAPAGADKPAYLLAWSDARQRAQIHLHDLDAPRAQAALRLPFADNEFDWVFCNEAIEHAGGESRREALISELYRVARKGVFATTENRRHPLEFNTGLLFLHWLPDAWWRRMLRATGRGRWMSAKALEPVGSGELYRAAERLPGSPEHDVGHKRIWGMKAHFFLMIRKRTR